MVFGLIQLVLEHTIYHTHGELVLEHTIYHTHGELVLEHTIYHTHGERTNRYINDAVLLFYRNMF
jgi:hypothetical protein